MESSEPTPSQKAIAFWTFVKAQLAERAPEVLETLNPGATQAQLDLTEVQLGVKLPEGFREFYKQHNGQSLDTVGLGLFLGMYAMSLEEIQRAHTQWVQILNQDPETYGRPLGSVKSAPQGYIDLRYIHPKWIPFATDQSGNYFALDFAPGPRGQMGQCITFGRDVQTKYLLGSSFEDFLSWLEPKYWSVHIRSNIEGFPPDSKQFELTYTPAASDYVGMMRFNDLDVPQEYE